MKSIYVKNTQNIKIGGQPSLRLEDVSESKTCGVLPAQIPHIKPKLFVKEGKVKVGTPLFYDKQDPRIKFLSPAGGEIKDITYGNRRSLDLIEIAVSDKEEYEKLTSIKKEDLSKTSREDLVNALCDNGVWAFLRAFPFNKIASPDDVPASIYVSIDNDEPHLPQSEVFLNGREDDFRYGLDILNKLTSQVVVGVANKNQKVQKQFQDVITHRLEGNYPANHPGVHLYYNKTSEKENNSWYIKAHDLILLAQCLSTGQFPTSRVVILAGSSAQNRAHYNIRFGAPFSAILGTESADDNIRYIAGGVLTGRKTTANSYFGYYDTALNLIPEGREPEMFSFFKPGFDKPSFSRTYLSALSMVGNWEMTSSINGGYRSCIACMQCPRVCPVELEPQLVMKSINSGDVEDAINQGFLDCVDCGLCTYVCPSKIELDNIFSSTKEKIVKELSA